MSEQETEVIEEHREVVERTSTLSFVQAQIQAFPEFANKMCKLWDDVQKNWYDRNWSDTNDEEEAAVVRVGEAVAKLSEPGNTWPITRFLILQDAVPVPVAAPPPPPAYVVKAVYTKDEASENLDHIRNLTCRLKSTSAGWWRSPNDGYTDDVEESYVYTVSEAYSRMDYNSEIHIMPEYITPPAPPREPQPLPDGTKPILLTLKQCKDNAHRLSRKQMYVLVDGEYIKDPYGTGLTYDRAAAVRITLASCTIGVWTHAELVDQELALRISKLKCNAEKVLGKSLMELLKLAPLNLTARAQVMAIIGTMPDAALDTYDKIRDWIESTYEPKVGSVGSTSPAHQYQTGGIRIPMSFSQDESGTCRYTARAYGSGDFNVDAEYIQGLIEDGLSLEDIIYAISDEARSEAWDQCDPNLETDDDSFEYRNHEPMDSENSNTEIDISSTELRNRVVSHLRQTQNVDTLDRLGI